MGRISAARASQLLWSIRYSGLGDTAFEPVSPEDYAALRRRHAPELAEALRIYALSIAELTLSRRLRRPCDIGAADWLVSLAPQFADSPLASWGHRNKSRLVRLVAELYALCPDLAIDPRALSQDGGPSLLDALFCGSAWACAVEASPFYDLAAVDRRSSFIGGFPWICEDFPWPRDRAGEALSPLFQLNLAELDLSSVAAFPPVLIQGWGDEIEFFTRAIPLAKVEGRVPSSQTPEWRQEHLCYLGNNRGSLGSKITTGSRFFSLETDRIARMADFLLEERFRSALGARAAKAERLLGSIRHAVLDEQLSKPAFVTSDHFGGQHHPRQFAYEPWEGPRALFEYHSFGGWPEEEDGLNIFFDGSMQVSFSPADLYAGYRTEGSR